MNYKKNSPKAFRDNLSKAASALGIRMFIRKDIPEYMVAKMVEGIEDLSLEKQGEYYKLIVPILESYNACEQVLNCSQEIIARLMNDK